MLVAAGIVAGILLLAAAPAGPASSGCAAAPLLLWGDGRHDDTAALNAWLRGRPIAWAETGESVPPRIEGNSFLLSGPIFVHSGGGRTLAHFRMVWPLSREAMTGGTIAEGSDPDRPPVVSGVSRTGGDPGEGVPFEAPASSERDPNPATDCLVS